LVFIIYSYVIDPGRVKRRVYDTRSGTSKFEISWISRAAADQRAGRAGRVGPGHCYRLYSSAVFSDTFTAFEEPEILRMPIEGLVLQLKALGISSISHFPFPSPPSTDSLLAAIKSLINLGALVPKLRSIAQNNDHIDNQGNIIVSSINNIKYIESEELTALGSMLAKLPLHPSLAKILVLAWQQERKARLQENSNHPAYHLLDYALRLVAAMTVDTPFVLPSLRDHGNSSETKPKSSGKDKLSLNIKDDDELSYLGSDAEVDSLLQSDMEEESNTLVPGEDIDPVEQAKKEKAKQEAERKRQERIAKRNAAYAAHARMRHPLSDALTLLRASGAYAYTVASANPGEGRKMGALFCRQNSLRSKSMREMSSLTIQLRHLVKEALGSTDPSVNNTSTSVVISNNIKDMNDDQSTIISTDNLEIVSVENDPQSTIGNIADAIGTADNAEIMINKSTNDEDAENDTLETISVIKTETTTNPSQGKKRVRSVPPPPLPPPSTETEILLRQCIGSGLLERVARKASPDQVQQLCAAAGVGKSRGWVPYIPASLTVTQSLHHMSNQLDNDNITSLITPPGTDTPIIFVHPTSAVDEADASLMPTYVCYTDIMISSGRKKRAYMRGVTALEENWLSILGEGTPLVHLDPPLAVPEPAYSANMDAVMCARIPIFGDVQWRFHSVPRIHPTITREDRDVCIRAFARALLEGHVISFFKKYSKVLAAPPNLITRQTPQKRVLMLLEALQYPPSIISSSSSHTTHKGNKANKIQNSIYTKAALLNIWKIQPGYLLGELGQWIQANYASTFINEWPKMVQQEILRN